MNKIPKAKKSQMIVVLLITVVVIAGLWFTVVKMQNANLAIAEKKTAEFRDKISKADAILKKAGQIQTELEKYEKELAKIEEGMASGDIYLWMINTLNDFNATHRVSIADFQRESLGEAGLLPKFPYKAALFPVRGTGYFHDIGRFLADFENAFPYARVQNLELSPATKTANSAPDAEKLNFTFQLVALIKPTEKVITTR